jgi:hypothetical protein
MSTIDLEGAISEFLAWGERLHSSQPVTGQQVLAEMIDWYRDTRIQDAPVDLGEDMLLFQWGTYNRFDLSAPTDLRSLSDDEIDFLEEERVYLDFTRQVSPVGDGDELEFDDVAVQMSISLYFQLADGSEPHANLWIYDTEDLEEKLAAFKSIPFVQSYLTTPSQILTIWVGGCG